MSENNTFKDLRVINVSDKTEQKNGLTYLSWAWAFDEMKQNCPDMSYEVKKFDNGLPYVYDPNTGYMVFTSVTIEGITHEMWLPVMDAANKAMKAEPYQYKVKDYKTRQLIEKTCEAATMFDINKTIMRCLTKNFAMFGLGLYIYAGEDLPESVEDKSEKPAELEGKYVTSLLNKCASDNVDVKKLCSKFNVKTLNNLTMDQLRYIVDNWSKEIVKECA